MSEADDQDLTLPQGTPSGSVPPKQPADSGEGGLDRTLPQGTPPRPVPARHHDTAGGQDGDADGGQATRLQGAGATVVQGADATVVQGSDSTQVRDVDDPSARRQTTTGEATKVFADRFEVIDQIGEGGMGRVYRVRDRQIAGREIALKVLRPRYSRNATFRDLFFKEIHASQGFVAEQVVQVRDTGQMKDGTLFLTMDLVDGDPLDEVLERESSLAARHALEVARQTLLGLASGHEHGLVHRDVKPSNVILAHKIAKTEDNPYGVGVRLLDFGIAGVAAEVEEGVVVGTPRYMSPEQVQGQRLDARSDLFAVGVLLYEMLTGERPFEGDTVQAVQTAVLETDIAPLISDLEGLPEPVRKILHKALQKDREKRFQSAAEFIEAIEKSKAYSAPSGVPRWVAALLVLFVLATIAEAGLLYLKQKDLDTLTIAAAKAGMGGVDFSAQLKKLTAEQDEIYRKELKALEDERDRAQAQLAQLQEEAKRNEGDQLTLLEAEVRRLDAEFKKEKEAKEKLLAELDKLRKNTEEYALQRTPERKAADLFDELLRRIEQDDGSGALKWLTSQEATGSQSIHPEQGRRYVGHVVEAASALQSAGALADLRQPGSDAAERRAALSALTAARKSLRDARASEAAFEVESAMWIDTERPDGIEVDRLAAIVATRERLESQAGELELFAQEIEQQDQGARAAERAKLLALTPDADPKEAIDYMTTYTDGVAELAVLVDRFAESSEAQWTASGTLDVEALTASAPLREWAEWLFAGGSGLGSEGARTVRWLWAARQWYTGRWDDGLAGFVSTQTAGLLKQLTQPEPHANWRAQLALAVELDRRPAWYPRMDGTVVVQNRIDTTGVVRWFEEKLSGSGQAGGWMVKRALYDQAGEFVTEPPEQEVRQVDSVLFIDGKKALDLRASDADVRVAAWFPILPLQLPEQRWTSSMNDKILLTTRIGPIPCLVYTQGEAQYWYAPGYGLVRQVLEGKTLRELAYSSLVR